MLHSSNLGTDYKYQMTRRMIGDRLEGVEKYFGKGLEGPELVCGYTSVLSIKMDLVQICQHQRVPVPPVTPAWGTQWYRTSTVLHQKGQHCTADNCLFLQDHSIMLLSLV